MIKWLFGAGLLCYLIARAILIPITHDEAGTILNYASKPIYDIISYQDPIPNNHLLNTLLIKFFVSIFGLQAWVCRLPNIMAGVLYLVYGIKILELLFKSEKAFIFLSLLLLIGNPYLIEFFALARGYGLSIGLLMASLYYALKATEYRDFTRSLILAALGVYANLTLLNYFIVLCFGVTYFTIRSGTMDWYIIKRMTWVITSLFLALVIPVKKMVDTDQFHFWSKHGFYQDTFLPLLQSSLEGKKYMGDYTLIVFSYLIGLVTLMILLGTIYLIIKNKRNVLNKISLRASYLFIGSIVYNFVQNKLLDIPFLNARTALFFYPLFIVAALAIWYDFRATFPKSLIGAGILVFSVFAVFHISRCYNLHSSYEWWFDGDNKRVISILEKQHHLSNQHAISFKCNWLFQPSLTYYIKGQKRPFITSPPYHQSIDTSEIVDYYYITSDDMSPWFKDNYKVEQSFAWDSRLLMKKKE